MNGADAGYAIIQYGTAAERLARSASAILPLTEWYDTDTGNYWKWYGAWYPYFPPASSFNPGTLGNQVGPAGSKTGVLGGTAGAANSLTVAGSSLNETSRISYMTPVNCAMSDITVYYAGWSLATSPTGEIVAPNTFTIDAYLEYNGVSTQITRNGVAFGVVNPGDMLRSDPVQVSIPANATFYIRTYITVPAGGQFFRSRKTASGSGEGTNGPNGANIAANTGSAGFSAALLMYGPANVSATYQRRIGAVLGVGDSILCGAGEAVPNSFGETGFFERALHNSMPWATNCRSGQKVAGFNLYHKYRLNPIMQQITCMFCELGVNDIFYDLTSFPAMQALYQTAWGEAINRGKPVVQTTITPFTTSTDGWTTVAGQTTFNVAAEAVRVQINEWLRTVPYPLRGIVDLADAVESSRNSGKWRVDLGVPTPDGLHPATVLSGGPMADTLKAKIYLLQ